MNVLLIEPNYKNKYPPMGLMKISTYHKNREDNVNFYKGEMPLKTLKSMGEIDRVYITSLFTFYYKKTVDTIAYYRKHIDASKIYVGGIMATLLTNQLQNDIGNIRILTGQLVDATMLGFDDHTNIDTLPLDYSILDQVEYDYPAGDNYFSYTTRGCPNHCAFCAVPILEPHYQFTNNIRTQIIGINEAFGEKRNLLLLDNNIFNLSVEEMKQLVDDLQAVGFTKEPTFKQESPLEYYLRKRTTPNLHPKVLQKAIKYLESSKSKIHKEKDAARYSELVSQLLLDGIDKEQFIIQNQKELSDILHRNNHSRLLQRYVDFNQGLEAARITPEKMRVLAKLPLNPVRIAFDHYTPQAVKNYEKAIRIAHSCGINNFSNYMLFNFDDDPDALWQRLKININLAKELHISIFSFPMKYLPITKTDRNHIGLHWNRKYLQAISAILIATKGVVAQGEDFFNRAFGKNLAEYHRILLLPRDFIIYRKYYEDCGLTAQWDTLYNRLNNQEVTELLGFLADNAVPVYSETVKRIAEFYKKDYSYSEITKGK